MMTVDQLDEFMERHFTSTAFRLETLDRYAVETDGADVARYLAGEPEPEPERLLPWLNELRQERREGRRRYRVHVLTSPLSDYLRYECEWGYVHTSAAGEEIYILDLAERARPAGLCDEDFWLVDDTHVVRMHYEHDGAILGADLAPQSELAAYRRCRDAALSVAVPFGTWWQAHPEEHRRNRLTRSGGV